MKLRNEVLLAIGSAWAVFLIAVYIGSHFFLQHSFLRLENEDAREDLLRINQALEQNVYSLYTYTADWSHWNSAYNFMRGKNPKFINDNLKTFSFANANINLVSYWNIKGKLIINKAIDTSLRKDTQFPNDVLTYLYPGSPLLDPAQNAHGYLLTPHGLLMIASSAVTDGDGKLPPMGVAIFGRWLSPTVLNKIADTVKLNLNLYLPKEINKNPALGKIYTRAKLDEQSFTVLPINQHYLHAYTIIKDIFGKPIGMVQVTLPRSIYFPGSRAIRYFLVSFIGLGIAFSFLSLWLLRNLIIRRIESLEHDLTEISKNNELSRRVNEKGNDELSSLSKKINNMISIIEASHQKLEYRVKERTQELQNTNIQLQQEIAERKSVQKDLTIHKEHLVRLAHYDNLTALPNRVYFNEMLTKILSQNKRHKNMLAILYIDIDKFKTINDALGHPTGDIVLKELSERFTKSLRSEDILARLGGDEFAVLLRDIPDVKFATTIAKKLLLVCRQPITVQAHEFVLSASVGISTFPADGTTLEALLKNADMAMYRAKQAGGYTFQYYTKEMDIEANERIKLEAALRTAINNREFLLYYQPKLDLISGNIMGVEALIRWENPVLGLVSPAKFIPLAEETGLILDMGTWALREACRANKTWQEQGYQPITMAVNLSAKQFRQQDIAQIIMSILEETQLDPRYLEVEITETAIMDNVSYTTEKLNTLKNMGVKITIDDFGTGYTSIGYLKQFPVSTVKIDQSFVKGLPDNANDASIILAVIALAHSLNMKVVAEGVETTEQLQFLADNNCDMVQGYYLSQPLPESNIILQLMKTSELGGNSGQLSL
jgi:diguanylate cyclase (GGDEF)-like protein